MSPRTYLVVNADDLGYSSGVNRGIFEAHDRGIVTSASLMVHRPAAAAAVAEIWSRPELGIGLHFDLGSWVDDDDGGRPREPGVPLDERGPAEIAAEAHAQLERFRELVGRDPTHLDSHRHVHCREPVRSVLAELAWNLGLPLRHTSEAFYCGDFHGQSLAGAPVQGSLRPERLATLLRHLPDGAAELCCHPGYAYGLDSSYAAEADSSFARSATRACGRCSPKRESRSSRSRSSASAGPPEPGSARGRGRYVRAVKAEETTRTSRGRCPRARCGSSTPTGGRTTSPSGRSTAREPAPPRAAAGRAREAAAPRPLGDDAGLNFVYAHLNRAIRARDLDAIFVCGPGHGGPGVVANAYLEGTYSELYSHVGRDEEGLRELFRQFSFPGGIPSHAAPETPGSIHEGGELGYALAHAQGAAFDNPDLVVACVVGDGEAETGPARDELARQQVPQPAARRRGAADPAPERLQDREPDGARPDQRRGARSRSSRATATGRCSSRATSPRRCTRRSRPRSTRRSTSSPSIRGSSARPRWPMIVLRTPKGWTGPKEVDGLPVEGTWRAHQVPLADVRDRPERLAQLEAWLRSYRPEELFDERGALVPELAELPPRGERRMSANPHANGGELLRDLVAAGLPRVRGRGRAAGHDARPRRRASSAASSATSSRRNGETFRIFGPDETASNRLGDVLEATDRQWEAAILPTDEGLAPEGRVIEMLSEHMCQGWLEGYLLTGRHGLFNCYEAFIHIVDSMFNQHAKWLKVTRGIPWRRPIASLNYLLSSHVWRQDHNGFSHQDPGFIDHVVNKKAEIIRVYLPPDANTLLSVADHCLRSRHYVNVIVAGKQPALQYLSMDDAIVHCTRGLGIWEWASNDEQRRAGRRARLLRRRADARDARRRGARCASACPS